MKLNNLGDDGFKALDNLLQSLTTESILQLISLANITMINRFNDRKVKIEDVN